ncbi:2',5'-phosphodiesterase 12 [Eufriesea mexicana]|uniref:2',5'-phosphodiesterase 12 n=2 Tax=Eufriesea mexicana TaxID=516756 RepID=A0A310SAE7_9HYME|nr:2',5'-phosphodiesterase 12 [Eufriesea mexicana]
MNEAILLHEEGSDIFTMSLRYVQSDLNIDRQFNFNRRINEPISNFTRRIKTNIGLQVMKKMYCKQKKHSDFETPLSVLLNDTDNNHIKFVRDSSILDDNDTCKTILENSSNVKLIIFNTEYVLRQNIPFITKIELPSSILVDFPVYPSKFEGKNVNKLKSTFTWYKNEGKEWIQVGQDFLYVPCMSDIGSKLKISCVPRNDTECGPIIEITSNNAVQNGPVSCPFETRHAFTKYKLSGKSFRVTSYNILANIYSETQLSQETLYPYCPLYALSMDYRKLLILKELMGYKSDIICLQEVDNSVYKNDLQLALRVLHYDSIYNLKNDLREGLAIFYNQDRFDKLYSDYSVISQGVSLDDFNIILSKIENNNAKQTFGNRNTIIQILILRSKENPEILVIGNTHLYFLPIADHVRLLQAYYGLLYLRTYAKRVKNENPECNVSILYCGDFNSTPDKGIYQLMTQNYITKDHSDWRADPTEMVQDVVLTHDLNLSSACGIPEYTNFTATFSGCLDYIFYQTDYLAVEQVIPIPSKETLKTYTGLPSIVFPSDHLSLCVDLKWLK